MLPTPPRILLDGPAALPLHARRTVRALIGRELGMAHATRALARVIPAWRELPIDGPDGLPLHIDLREVEGVLQDGWHNTTRHTAHVMSRLRDGDVVIDVGANIGGWSRLALSSARLSRLHAFEPGGRTAELLALNLQGHANAHVEPYAVGERSGWAEFTTGRNSENRVTAERGLAGSTRTVAIVSLDEWAESAGLDRLDMLKIDTEGNEPAVIAGASRTIQRFRPAIVIEWFRHEPRAALDRLESVGYWIQAIAFDGSLLPCDSSEPHSNDYLALPR